MAVNKVNFGGNTLIDLTGDTLESAEQLLKGIIAHARDGSQIVGALEAGGGSKKVYIEQKTFASNQTSVKIKHNFGELPTIFLQLMIATSSGKYTKKARIGVGYNKDGVAYGTTAFNSSSSSTFNFTNYPPVERISDITDTDCTFIPCGGNTSGSYYYAGDTYLFALVGGVQL